MRKYACTLVLVAMLILAWGQVDYDFRQAVNVELRKATENLQHALARVERVLRFR